MTLLVRGKGVTASIVLDEDRGLHASYSFHARRSDREHVLHLISNELRCSMPVASVLHITDLRSADGLIDLNFYVGVTQPFDRPLSIDSGTPALSVRFASCCTGLYRVDGICGRYSVHDHRVPTSAIAVHRSPRHDVFLRDERLHVTFDSFAHAPMDGLFVNNVVARLVDVQGNTCIYDPPALLDGLNMLRVGDVGVKLMLSPREACLDAPAKYEIARGCKLNTSARLMIWHYNRRLPQSASLKIDSCVVKGGATFNPHEGNLRRLLYCDGNEPCSNCPCLYASNVVNSHVNDVCITRHSLSIWVDTSEPYHIACSCGHISCASEGMCIAYGDSEICVRMQRGPWVHIVSDGKSLVVDTKCVYEFPICGSCSCTIVTGVVRALCVFAVPLDACMIVRLFKYPDIVIQEVTIPFTLMCKWPHRSGGGVTQMIDGIRAAPRHATVTVIE